MVPVDSGSSAGTTTGGGVATDVGAAVGGGATVGGGAVSVGGLGAGSGLSAGVRAIWSAHDSVNESAMPTATRRWVALEGREWFGMSSRRSLPVPAGMCLP